LAARPGTSGSRPRSTPAGAANEDPAAKTVSINVVAAANSPLTSLPLLEAEVRALETFQLEVRALVRSHALTTARGNALIAEAAAIIG
jgi:hypothetical protein